MTYNFRNREHIKAPVRLEDPEDEPRQVLYKEPDIDHEVYASPRCSRAKYNGPIIPFNPKLRPASFPTLDLVRQARSVEPEVIDLYTPSPFDKEGTRDTASGTNAIHQRMKRTHTAAARQAKDASATSLRRSCSSPVSLPHDMNGTAALGLLHHRELQPRHDGTPASILSDNMRRIEHAASMNAFDRNMLEMISSEEEDDDQLQKHQTTTQARKQELLPEWRDLAAAHKLQLFDIVQEAHPGTEWDRLLRLTESDMDELNELVIERNGRFFREQAAGDRHRKETQQKLLRGAIMNKDRFRRSLEQNIYRSVGMNQDDFNLSKASHLEQAKAYLAWCQLNPKLLDGAWATIPAASAASLKQVQNMAPGSLASDEMERISTGLVMDSEPAVAAVIQRKTPHLLRQSKELLHSQRSPVNASDDARSPSEDPSPLSQKTQSGKTLHLRPPKALPVARRKVIAEGNLGLPPSPLTTHRQEHPSRGHGTRDDRSKLGEDAATREDPSPTTPTRAKRHVSPGLETDFLNHERRPGARQPKPTEKVVQAEATALTQAMSVRKRRRRGPRNSDQCSGGPAQSPGSSANQSITPTNVKQQTLGSGRMKSGRSSNPTLTSSNASDIMDQGKRSRKKPIVPRNGAKEGSAESPHAL